MTKEERIELRKPADRAAEALLLMEYGKRMKGTGK